MMQVAESFSFNGERSLLKRVPKTSRLHAAQALTEIFNRLVVIAGGRTSKLCRRRKISSLCRILRLYTR